MLFRSDLKGVVLDTYRRDRMVDQEATQVLPGSVSLYEKKIDKAHYKKDNWNPAWADYMAITAYCLAVRHSDPTTFNTTFKEWQESESGDIRKVICPRGRYSKDHENQSFEKPYQARKTLK